MRRTFVRGATDGQSTVGTTWHTADACLGSVNRSSLWTQRRPLIAYWKTDVDHAVVFRLRFLHDDRDFASTGVNTHQEGNRTLSVFHTLKDQGDWHPNLDRPKDGAFSAEDFRVRFELTGKEVTAEELGDGRYVLRAGGRRAVIHTLPGRFAGQPIVWQLGRDKDSVFLDGICYHGPKQAFNVRQLLEIVLAAGVELLPADAAPAASTLRLSGPQGGAIEAVWEVGGGLKVDTR